MNPLARLWKDKMTVYRFQEITEGDITHEKDGMVCDNIPCKYSKSSLTEASEGAPQLVNRHILFCARDTDIKEGDKVVVTQRNGNTVELAVGEGFPYTSHIEFSVERKEFL
ncbi:hypothetical protein CS063_01520 [Sporanaerobium hydrogeniformans]|uniref:Uncharacterized protein n=1 Tax=Sporanaerobium hydrogeniformans TaxID=3072179 RepID=A0AC61DG82_9FIRM|nr:hypothetical protein [Sporanaerobium hydrogeniformans]PHV72181.1 hypothetical protein CS063_01520 [Sporanaerobium hydrogeniformans]